jgi:hypothetical protein
MRFSAIFLAALASTVAAQGMAGHDMGPAATDAPSHGAAGAPATTPAAAAPKGDKKAAKPDEEGKPVVKGNVINQINDGQVQAPPAPPTTIVKTPEGTSTHTSKVTKTVKLTSTPSKPATQTKNAAVGLSVGSGLGLLGLAAAIIA